MSNPFLPNEPDYRNVDTERRYNLWFKVADTGDDFLLAVTNMPSLNGKIQYLHGTYKACLQANGRFASDGKLRLPFVLIEFMSISDSGQGERHCTIELTGSDSQMRMESWLEGMP